MTDFNWSVRAPLTDNNFQSSALTTIARARSVIARIKEPIIYPPTGFGKCMGKPLPTVLWYEITYYRLTHLVLPRNDS